MKKRDMDELRRATMEALATMMPDASDVLAAEMADDDEIPAEVEPVFRASIAFWPLHFRTAR